MKIKFKKKEFLRAVKIGGSFCGSKKVLPILECIRITIKSGSCWIMSYDDRNAIKTKCQYEESEEDIEFCINKNEIDKYVSLIDDEYFILDVDISSKSAIIKTTNGDARFCIEDANEYPTLKQEVNAASFELSADLLAYWMRKSIPFLYNDDLQPNHQNMHFIIKDGKLEVFAFGYTKMYHDSSNLDFEGELKMSIDRNCFNGVLSAIGKEDNITIKEGDKNTIILSGDTMILLRKSEFNMHNYQMLLSRHSPIFEVAVDKNKLKGVIMRAESIHDNNDTSTLTIEFNNKELIITSEFIEKGKKFRENLPFISADKDDISFNISFTTNVLQICLNSISSDIVLLRPSGNQSLFEIKNPDYDTERSYVAPCKAN